LLVVPLELVLVEMVLVVLVLVLLHWLLLLRAGMAPCLCVTRSDDQKCAEDQLNCEQ
jgi:hypothetical protein